MNASAAGWGLYGSDVEEEMVAVWGHAFRSDPDSTRAWIAAAGTDAVRVWRAQGRPRGGMLLLPFGQYFGGKRVSMTGIAGVAVGADARRQGVGQSMMRAALHELRSQNVALSTLFASTHGLYRGVGYEHAGSRYWVDLDLRMLRSPRADGRLDAATVADQDDVRALYEELAPRWSGFLGRSNYLWRRIWGERRGVPAYGLVLRHNGRVAAYLYYREVADTEERYRIDITDWMASSRSDWLRLLAHLQDVATMAWRVRWNGAPTDPAYALLGESWAMMTLHENWMTRIVHVPRALCERGYDPTMRGQVNIAVIDSELPDNRGPWKLSVEGGHVECTPTAHADVSLDVRGLAALYTGFASPALLSATGLVDGEPTALARLGSLFGGGAPWMREIF